MGFFTRPDLDDRQFKQEASSTLNLSGTTNISGGTFAINWIPIDLSTGLTAGNVLTYDGSVIRLLPSTGGGSDIYSGASPSNIAVGGMPIGTVLTGRTYTSILQEILIDTINPIINGPNNTLSENVANLYEVGTILGSITFTATFSQGSIIPQYDNTGTIVAPSAPRSGLPNTYTYTGAQIAGSYPSALLTNQQIATNYKILLGSNTWTNTVSYDASTIPAYNSDGNLFSAPLGAGTTGSKSVTLTGRYMRFYGSASATPTNSAEVRALPQMDFQSANVQTFQLNTGAVLTKFVVALPPGRTINEVIDLDALNANITSQYVLQGTITVNDGGGTGDPRIYNLYEMNIGAPYSSNHRHQITTA